MQCEEQIEESGERMLAVLLPLPQGIGKQERRGGMLAVFSSRQDSAV
jgi:hypothetical protein